MDYENLTPQYRIEEYLEAIVEGWADATEVAYPEVPSWRIEEFLDAFITYIWEDGDHPRKPCPEPVWRLEECLRAIYDVMTGAATPWAFPTPTNRIEEYLAAIHAYLADGTELPVPEPVWRIEQWLAYVLEGVKQGGDIEKTVSGTMVHITDALAKAALSVLVSIEPIQDLHGYANPWPAGGGKNLFDVSTWLNNIGIAYTVDSDGWYNISSVAGNNGSIFSIHYNLSESITGSVTMMVDTSGTTATNVRARLYDGETVVAESGTGNPSISTIENRVFDAICFNFGSGGTVKVKCMIERGATATSYAPYSNICPISGRTGLSVYVSPTTAQADATTYSVDWTTQAGTVYGGTVDLVTGELTITHACVDMGDLTYSYASSDTVFYTNLADKVDGALLMKCSCYKTGGDTGYSTPDYTVGFSSVSSLKKRIFIGDPRYTSPSDLKTALAGQTLYYWLATPLTYQLSEQEVQMLLGENYVWSSSGDTVSVTYYAEGNANPLQSLNILLGGNYSNPKTADDVSDKEALDIILGGNK